jgi:hypothetical protein
MTSLQQLLFEQLPSVIQSQFTHTPSFTHSSASHFLQYYHQFNHTLYIISHNLQQALCYHRTQSALSLLHLITNDKHIPFIMSLPDHTQQMHELNALRLFSLFQCVVQQLYVSCRRCHVELFPSWYTSIAVPELLCYPILSGNFTGVDKFMTRYIQQHTYKSA